MSFQLPPTESVSTETRFLTKKFHGLTCVIETPKDTLRHGRNWSMPMPADYGYIQGFTGADGDDIDCYLGSDTESEQVFIVDQRHLHSPGFDEHKCLLGFKSKEDAMDCYINGHTDAHQVLLGVTEVTLQEFMHWLHNGNLTQPLHEE